MNYDGMQPVLLQKKPHIILLYHCCGTCHICTHNIWRENQDAVELIKQLHNLNISDLLRCQSTALRRV